MLLDIGIGILASLWLDEPLWIGILFALAPDIDALVHFVQYRGATKGYRHRDMLHLPLPYLLLSVFVYLLSPSLALLFFVCIFLHFVHDSIGIGWGVQWLWPISTRHFSFLYLYQPKGKPNLPKKYFYTFRHEEIDRLEREFGDPDWFQNIYLRFHPYALLELALFIAALVSLTLS